MIESEDSQVEVTSEEFNEWASNKVTQSIVNEIVFIRDNLTSYLVNGGSVAKDADVSTDRAVGRIEGINQLFNLFTEAKEDSKKVSSYGH